MSPTRNELSRATTNFCQTFAQQKSLDEIISLFSTIHEITAIEHGDSVLLPFLGKEFVGANAIKEYFITIGRSLSFEDIKFSEYVIDTEALKVSLKGQGKFTWLSTRESWNEVFTYTLDFDDELKVVKYQIWGDSGAVYLAKSGKLGQLKKSSGPA